MKKLFLRAEFGPLWEPWEEDEIGRNILYRRFPKLATFFQLLSEKLYRQKIQFGFKILWIKERAT